MAMMAGGYRFPPISRSNSGFRTDMGLCRTRIGLAIAGSCTLRAHTHPKRTGESGICAHQTSKPPSRKRFSILGCWDDRFLGDHPNRQGVPQGSERAGGVASDNAKFNAHHTGPVEGQAWASQGQSSLVPLSLRVP
jgi:hypothetical protein